MKSLVLDTNVFLRFLLNDVADQANQVTDLFKAAKAHELKISIPQIIVFEIAFALEKYYKFPKNKIVDKLGVLLTTPYLQIQDVRVFQEALILFNRKNIDFVDCFLISLAQDKDTELFTFDKNLQNLAKKSS